MPGPGDLFAQIQAKGDGPPSKGPPGGLGAMLAQRAQKGPPGAAAAAAVAELKPSKPAPKAIPEDKLFIYDEDQEAFLFAFPGRDGRSKDFDIPRLVADAHGNENTDILVPLAPCAYRLADYTYAKKEPVLLRRCILKLGVLRCLQRECKTLNKLLWYRLNPAEHEDHHHGTIEDDELGKARFMELLSNCGVYQKVSELVLKQAGNVADEPKTKDKSKQNPYRIPQVRVDGLDEFMETLERLTPSLAQARKEIEETQTVSFYPGLGELFCPGSKLLCHPEGMEGSPLGCSCVQSWYAEELNKATNKMKRRFILVVEFIVSVGDELVFVAASDVYPEFHDPSRNLPIKDLTHRKLLEEASEDSSLLERLQQRGEFYASVATKNHYLEYYPNSFFPIIGGGWNNNAVRPLSKGGRVMVDVKRGILEGHIPVRGTSDGMSDTVKEAIKLFDQSKRTGVAVPFRTCILPGFEDVMTIRKRKAGDSDRHHLWQSWPMLTGFSFTARVWGKLLLGMPKPVGPSAAPPRAMSGMEKRNSSRVWGVQVGGLGGEGSCGNCGYIKFQEQAFEQLVLADDKKELIRAVARNAGGGASNDHVLYEDYDDNDDDDEEDVALDVVANKGAASIFLLHGPPGCGKTLTAEAISELLKKPLYIVTAGDLGITAAEVEKTLGSVLELCQTWDALVLIDEADIFLEARTSTEIQRNALVCVMLRLLEYYSGCLFLSSNRSAANIDDAIASRITVMLGYPALDKEGRAKVWKNLIELVRVVPNEKVARNPFKASRYRLDFTAEDYDKLASEYTLNGRQIKNSIVLARALARERKTALSLPILHRAVTAVAGESASKVEGY